MKVTGDCGPLDGELEAWFLFPFFWRAYERASVGYHHGPHEKLADKSDLL